MSGTAGASMCAPAALLDFAANTTAKADLAVRTDTDHSGAGCATQAVENDARSERLALEGSGAV